MLIINSYLPAKKAGLGAFAQEFGISAAQLGENSMENYTTHVPADSIDEPYVRALAFVRSDYPDAESVLKATRSMCAQEIACDPYLRQSVR